MAVGMLLAGEGITEDSYRKLSEKMFGSFPMPQGEAPDGLIIHSAGQSDQGWYIYDIWESKEHFQRFAEGKIMPAAQEAGLGQDFRPQPQFFPIETLVKG